MNSYISIIKADYLQRARSYGFLITLLVSVCLAYTFIPPAGAHYATVRIGSFIGEINSAWIGYVTAIMASTFLWLIGFYLVNNGIKRDKETGVGQIIATTSISNFKYLIAKALSNFLVLLTITLIIIGVALCMLIVRGGNYSFDAWQFFSPYLFSTIPAIFFVSVLAVVAEVVLGNYSNLQNIIFFFLSIIVIMNINLGSNPKLQWTDILGTKVLTDGMADVVNTHYSKTIQPVSVGFALGMENSTKRFLFNGTHWSAIFILSRFLWTGIAFLLLFISARLFHRFDVNERFTIKRKFSGMAKNTFEIIETRMPLKEIHLSSLPIAAPAFGIFPFVKIELLMLLRKGPKWFWLLNAGGFIALIFMPLTAAHQIGLPVIWFLQINRWADIATKEKYNRTHYFTYAAYKPLQRLLTSQIIAGFLLSAALASPVIIRYLLSGDYLTAISILLGAGFVVSLSVSCGILSGGKRFFEIIFFLLTYANINAAPPLDYFGAFNSGFPYLAILIVIISILFLVSFLFRKYEIRNQ